ncbi:MAG: hypothetical protein ACLP1X_21315 [Polyangiaceae bacterium]|jgi:hypothetical protein
MMTRRDALMSTLFGAGWVGLRALATGLPASFFINPRKALASPAANKLAQYVIFQTSGNGDPINANVPGMYNDTNGSQGTSGIYHSPSSSMAATSLKVGSWSGQAALPWAQPYQAVPTVGTAPLLGSVPGGSPVAQWQTILNQTTFWHIATTTPVHPKEPDVLKMMDQTASDEMLVSILSKQLQPELNTIQAQPIALGAASPSESLVYGGQAQPLIPPTALKATLTNPTGPLSSLQKVRDQTMNSLYQLYYKNGTPAQQAYIDSLTLSQTQARNISQSLLSMLDAITDNLVVSQVVAAIALIKMNVTPVLTIHIPFGGDNHRDTALAAETQQTTGVGNTGIGYSSATGLTGVPAIAWLMNQLYANNLQDQVTFMSLNVFGRTLATSTGCSTGRQHNPNHHVAITIGSGFKAGVVGGVAPATSAGAACTEGGSTCDYGAVSFESTTGMGSSSGDVTPATSLPSWGQTMMAAVGIDSATIASSITTGKVISGALAS